jgi:branched-chain amino acid transport system substrate-binding protein
MSMPVRGLAAVAVLCVLSGCTTAGSDAARPVQDIGLGLLAPLSGPDSALGADQRRGAELATEIVNDDHHQVALPLAAGTGLPNLGGARLRLSVADTGGTTAAAETQLDRLVTDLRPVALIGGDRNEVAAAAGQHAERLRVPFLDAGSSASYVAEVGLDWYFRTAPNDRMLGAAVFSLLTRVSAGRIALVQPADGRHTDLAAVIGELAADAEVDVVATVRSQEGAEGPSGAAAKVEKSGVDAAVVIAATEAEAVALASALEDRVPALPVIGVGPGFTGSGFAEAAGEAANGVLRPVPWSAEYASRNKAAGTVDELYQRRFGTPMTAAAAGAFTAVMTLATAIDDAAATDAAGVRSALRVVDVPGTRLIVPWVGVQFGAGGQNERAAAVVEQFDGEKVHLIHPVELATAPVRWPGLKSARQ